MARWKEIGTCRTETFQQDYTSSSSSLSSVLNHAMRSMKPYTIHSNFYINIVDWRTIYMACRQINKQLKKM